MAAGTAGARASAISWNRITKKPRAVSSSRSTGRTIRSSEIGAVAEPKDEARCFDAAALLRRLIQRRAQLDPQFGADGLEQVDRRLAARVLQEDARHSPTDGRCRTPR